MTDLAKLSTPFPPDRVSWRVGSTTQDKKKGMALAYIDARDVMARLDEVCGVAGWQNRYPHANGKTVCEIGIKIGDEWIWKADGAGDSDVEAEKGALSDAFKRAAVRWGIGRYLYDVASPWVELNERKQFTDAALKQLTALLAKGAPAPKPEPVAEDSEMAKAKEIYKRVKLALQNAKSSKVVDDILKVNATDLTMIRENYTDSYDNLMALAESRKVDLHGVAA